MYVARNPKDVIVSFFYHHKLWLNHQEFSGDVEQFAEYFMKDQGERQPRLLYSLYQSNIEKVPLFLLENLVLFAPMFPHFLDAWNKRNHPNMHFIFYEDLKKVRFISVDFKELISFNF